MKPTIPEVIERFRAYYNLPGNGAWGSLHVVLEDANVEDRFVRDAIDRAEETGDVEGAELGRILLHMSKSQRLRLPRKV